MIFYDIDSPRECRRIGDWSNKEERSYYGVDLDSQFHRRLQGLRYLEYSDCEIWEASEGAE